jgi:hypothetical protein
VTAYDARFDEAEAEVDRGEPWKPKENSDHPNPLTIIADRWVTFTHEKFGEGELLVGRDRNNMLWSILVSSTVLKNALIDGVFKEFDPEQNAMVEKERLGKVQEGEVVSIKYLGKKEGGAYGEYDNFNVVRKAALPDDENAAVAEQQQAPAEDPSIPFDDGVPD